MRNILPIFTILIFLTSCSSGGDTSDGQEQDVSAVSSDSVEVFEAPEYFLSREAFDTLGYGDSLNILIYASYESEEEAIKYVDTLLEKYNKAGYVNGDDFGSLENGKFHLFTSHSIYWVMMDELLELKTEYPEAYITLLNDNKNALKIKSKTEVIENGKAQPIVLIYADPEEEAAYFEEGGEDWMWRVADFTDYFKTNYPEVNIFNFHSTYFEDEKAKTKPLTSDLKAIYDDLDLGEAGFSFVLLSGDKKELVGYGAGVEESIVPALRFFGYEVPDDIEIYWE